MLLDYDKLARNTVLLKAKGLTLPLSFSTPFSWAQTRGIDPYHATIVIPIDNLERLQYSDNSGLVGKKPEKDPLKPTGSTVAQFISRLRGVDNPVSLEFTTPSFNSIYTPVSLTYENLYMEVLAQGDDQFLTLVLKDRRRELEYLTLNRMYNIRSYGNQYRRTSTDGGEPWKVIHAIQDAFRSMGLLLRVHPSVDAASRNVQLPDNTGNAVGGGWFGAKMDEWFPMYAEYARVDLTVNRKGEYFLVGRNQGAASSILTPQLMGLPVGGFIGEREINWTRPQTIRVERQTKLQYYLRLSNVHHTTDVPEPTSQQAIITVNNRLRNVAIVNDTILQVGTGTAPEYRSVLELIAAMNLTEAQVRARWTAQQLWTFDDGIAGGSFVEHRQLEAILRECYRSWFEPVSETFKRCFSQFEVGTMAVDGTTLSTAVNADATIVYRKMVYLAGSNEAFNGTAWQVSQEQSVSDEISQSVLNSMLVDPDNLVVKISPKANHRIMSVYVGHFEQPLFNWGRFDVTAEGPVEVEQTMTLKAAYEVLIPFHAVVVNRIRVPESNTLFERITVDEFPGYADGGTPTLTVRDDGEMVHWAPQNGILDSIYTRINKATTDMRNKVIVDAIRNTYEQYIAGMLEFAGLELYEVSNVDVPHGDIYELSVSVGKNDTHEIRSELYVQPQVRQDVAAAFATIPVAYERSGRIL